MLVVERIKSGMTSPSKIPEGIKGVTKSIQRLKHDKISIE